MYVTFSASQILLDRTSLLLRNAFLLQSAGDQITHRLVYSRKTVCMQITGRCDTLTLARELDMLAKLEQSVAIRRDLHKQCVL
jgi:hypothetical protein